MSKKHFMVDQVDRKKKMKALKKGGSCEFFKYPNGVISTGAAFLTIAAIGK